MANGYTTDGLVLYVKLPATPLLLQLEAKLGILPQVPLHQRLKSLQVQVILTGNKIPSTHIYTPTKIEILSRSILHCSGKRQVRGGEGETLENVDKIKTAFILEE